MIYRIKRLTEVNEDTYDMVLLFYFFQNFVNRIIHGVGSGMIFPKAKLFVVD